MKGNEILAAMAAFEEEADGQVDEGLIVATRLLVLK